MSWDTITDQWIWFSAAAVFLILVGILVVYNLYKSKPSDAIQNRKDDWTPTGRIDFTDPRSNGDFILQVEDTRIVDSMGGVEHREIRWRKATRDEAKTVVIAYHAQRNLAMTANYIVSSRTVTRPNAEVENVHQEGKDETPDPISQG